MLKSANVGHASRPDIATKSSPAEVGGSELKKKQPVCAALPSAMTEAGATAGGGEGGVAQAWVGVAKEGTYRPLSANSVLWRWARPPLGVIDLTWKRVSGATWRACTS